MVVSTTVPVVTAQTYPTVTINVVRIQEIDAIDGFGGDWDWYYWLGLWGGSSWNWYWYEAPNGQDVLVGNTHPVDVYSTTLQFAFTVCEGDFWSNDDVADISSGPEGGYDDSGSNCNPTAGPFSGSYEGTYNLLTNTLMGDTTVVDPQGHRTSGDFDGNSGDENDANFWFTISDNYWAPVADPGMDKTGKTGESISFDASGSTASSGSSLEDYAWDFTDDGVWDGSGKIVAHSYSSAGTYTARLRVTDSLGVTSTNTLNVQITSTKPTAAFSFSPSSPKTSEDVEFQDTSTDSDGTIASWHWDFDDGSTSTNRNPTHSFEDDGSHSVTLTVTDNDGLQDSVTKTVSVKNRKPVAGFTCTPLDPTTKDTMEFTDSSSDEDGNVEKWNWDFGDGYTSQLQNPTHKFEEEGQYTVGLTITDDDGDKDTMNLKIEVAKAQEGLFGGDGASDYLWIFVLIVIVVVVAIIAMVAIRRGRNKGVEYPPEGPPQQYPPEQQPPQQPPPSQ
jgi:PKD repeat protein